jgi:hypothetical protein
MKEIWKDIEGFEGLYQVSNKGHVYSLGGRIMGRLNNRYKNKPRILKTWLRNGYEHVHLRKDKNLYTYKVHRLVAQAFIPNPLNLPFVNHKDENKTNNIVYVNNDNSIDFDKSNLEWCTAKYNLNYGTHNQKMIDTKSKNPINQLDLNGNIINVFKSAREVERKYGYIHQTITNCCKGKYGYKTAYGYKWEFANVRES